MMRRDWWMQGEAALLVMGILLVLYVVSALALYWTDVRRERKRLVSGTDSRDSCRGPT